MGERNLAAATRADVDAGQSLGHLPNMIELMCINKTR